MSALTDMLLVALVLLPVTMIVLLRTRGGLSTQWIAPPQENGGGGRRIKLLPDGDGVVLSAAGGVPPKGDCQVA